MVTVIIFELMVENIKANEKLTKCMVKEYLNGLMEEYMMENILKIKNRVQGFFHGLMEESIQENGKVLIFVIFIYLFFN